MIFWLCEANQLDVLLVVFLSSQIQETMMPDNSRPKNLTTTVYPKSRVFPRADDIRLAGADVPHRGRVEVLMNGQYGTVCDDGFDATAAGVVCRSLGYVSGVAAPSASFGQGETHVYWARSIYACGWPPARWHLFAPGLEMRRSQPLGHSAGCNAQMELTDCHLKPRTLLKA